MPARATPGARVVRQGPPGRVTVARGGGVRQDAGATGHRIRRPLPIPGGADGPGRARPRAGPVLRAPARAGSGNGGPALGRTDGIGRADDGLGLASTTGSIPGASASIGTPWLARLTGTAGAAGSLR